MATTLNQLRTMVKPEIVESAQRRADEAMLKMNLGQIRQLAEKTQQELAEAMGVKQPTIARLERDANDTRLSTVKRYVEALGGHMSLTVELPDGTTHGFRI